MTDPSPDVPRDASGYTSDRFTVAFEVSPADIDDLGHVNNVVYVRWVQDAAIAHWLSASTEAQQRELGWVALRHEIDYRHPARPGDAIVAETWVGTADALRFERFVEIRRASDRRILAESRTLWCAVNRATGRPVRVREDVRRAFSRG